MDPSSVGHETEDEAKAEREAEPEPDDATFQFERARSPRGRLRGFVHGIDARCVEP
jgi:hypothetical protein